MYVGDVWPCTVWPCVFFIGKTKKGECGYSRNDGEPALEKCRHSGPPRQNTKCTAVPPNGGGNTL